MPIPDLSQPHLGCQFSTGKIRLIQCIQPSQPAIASKYPRESLPISLSQDIKADLPRVPLLKGCRQRWQGSKRDKKHIPCANIHFFPLLSKCNDKCQDNISNFDHVMWKKLRSYSFIRSSLFVRSFAFEFILREISEGEIGRENCSEMKSFTADWDEF